MIKFTIKPNDVLFFGSGKPFNIGDVAESIFPPYPNTFAGAICAKIWAFYGIDVSKILRDVFGPFLEIGGKVHFPKPANLFKERKKEEIEVYEIEPKELGLSLFRDDNTNKLEGFSLPIYAGKEEVEPFTGFISVDGLKKWLGKTKVDKGEIISFDRISLREKRIGIKMDYSINAVGGQEDALYSIGFLRLKENISFVFWVDFDFNNEELKRIGLIDDNKIMVLCCKDIYKKPP